MNSLVFRLSYVRVPPPDNHLTSPLPSINPQLLQRTNNKSQKCSSDERCWSVGKCAFQCLSRISWNTIKCFKFNISLCYLKLKSFCLLFGLVSDPVATTSAGYIARTWNVQLVMESWNTTGFKSGAKGPLCSVQAPEWKNVDVMEQLFLLLLGWFADLICFNKRYQLS